VEDLSRIISISIFHTPHELLFDRDLAFIGVLRVVSLGVNGRIRFITQGRRDPKAKMSPIRHSTLCKSMKFDVKDCKQNWSCNGCNLLKNCKLM
jgi:hypothetical protein